MPKLARTYVWNQQEYEVIGNVEVPTHYLETNKHPMVVILPDGGHALIDLSRDGLITHMLPDEETEYGVLEAEVIGDD